MIIYVGNKLQNKGYTPSSVDVISPLLARKYELLAVSDKSSQLARLFDIIKVIVVNRRKVKLILIDTYSTLGFYFALTVAFLARVLRFRYVPILHGGNLESRLIGSEFLSRYIFSGKWVYRLVAPSYFLFTVFEKHGYKKLVYIPNNLPIDEYVFTRRSSFSPRLLWVRSFNQLYNPFMAVHTLRLLMENYPDAKLCMVGPDKDGTLAQCRELAEKSGISDHIEFTGKLTKTEWHAKSSHYDIFINTSNVDNTPVSVMEAMALGLPVVSTNVGGIPFLLADEKEAFLVNPNDAAQMAARITRIIGDPLMTSEMAARARKKAEGFDWEIVKQSWYKLIDDAL